MKIVHINFVFNSSNKLYDITRIISPEDPFVSLGNLQTDPLTQNLLDILSSPPQSQSNFKRKSCWGGWDDVSFSFSLDKKIKSKGSMTGTVSRRFYSAVALLFSNSEKLQNYLEFLAWPDVINKFKFPSVYKQAHPADTTFINLALLCLAVPCTWTCEILTVKRLTLAI